MKLIASILSVYLVFLLAIPCCSFDNCPDDKMEQSASHEKGDEECGNCSPFFTCTGCSGATLSVENGNFEIFPLMANPKFTGYILSFIPDVHYDFWQPPKLA
jgi:hypothetical protein